MRFRISVPLTFLLFSLFVFLPGYLLAQDTNPPHCCNTPGSGGIGTTVQSSIVMTDTTLTGLGLSRTEFVERLISGLMPGKDVSFVYTTTISLDPSSVPAVAGQLPESVKITQQFRIPKALMRPENIQGLDQFTITDGTVSIDVKFVKAETVPLP